MQDNELDDGFDVQARAGKLSRMVRLIRLIRIVKLYKSANQHIKREETKRIINDMVRQGT